MRKPQRPCGHVGCRNLTRNQYCKDHEYLIAERNRDYNHYRRDPTIDAFYKTVAWQKVRQQALIRDHGLCVICKHGKKITVADMVDHIVPIRVDWSLRLDLKNLQSLCDSCHKSKTAEDKRRYKYE